jgi:hypothetical protein
VTCGFVVGVAGFEPAASSSRSQRAMRSTIALPLLTCLALSVDVRWRPLVSVAVVTHLVTHPPRGAVAVATGLILLATDRSGGA